MKKIFLLLLVLVSTFCQIANAKTLNEGGETPSSRVNAPPPPQGSLSANGPFCGSGTVQLTWTSTSGTAPFTIVFNDGIGANQTVTGVAGTAGGVVFFTSPTPITSSRTYTIVSVTDATIPTPVTTLTAGLTNASAIVTVIPNGANTLEDDRSALIALYTTAGGANWTNTTNNNNKWIFPGTCGDNPCGWYGVTCSGGRVTGVNLPNNNLIGTIPASIGNLTDLTVLNLSSNQLTGNIPTRIVDLGGLTSLNLSSNQLTGSFSLSGISASANVQIHNNKFNFDGIQGHFLKIDRYSPQAKIPIINTAGVLSVNAGGVLVNNIYNWYNGTSLVASNAGNANYTPTTSGTYYVEVNNTLAVDLTLISENATVTIPQGSLITTTPTLCAMGAGKLTWIATQGTGPFTVVYNDGTSNQTATNVASNTPFDVSPSSVASTKTYTLVSVTGSGATAGVRTTGFTGNAATITVNPLPTLTLGTIPSICVGATSFTIPYTASANTPTTYSISGTGIATAITDAALTASTITVNISAAVAGTNTYMLTVKNANSCVSSNIPISVVVNALPTLTLATTIPAVCEGATSITIPYTASANAPDKFSIRETGAATAISTDVMLPASTIAVTIGAAVAGTKNYTLTVKNTTTSCVSSDIPVSVVVNPLPTITLATAIPAICVGATSFTIPYTATTNTNSPTTYSVSGTNGTKAVTDVALTASPITVDLLPVSVFGTDPTYTLTLKNGNTCVSSEVKGTVFVNPIPTVAVIADDVVCNGESVDAITLSGTPTTGVVYKWTNDQISIGLAASGTGNIPTFVATNASATTPVVATITVTPYYTNGGTECVGTTPEIFTITVNPTPTVTPSLLTQVICNGLPTTAVTFTPVSGVVYNWTNDKPEIGLVANGMGDVASFMAKNTGTAPITAKIKVTPSYTNASVTCDGASVTFEITVNPTPKVELASIPNQVICNTAMSAAVNFMSLTSGTTYSWINDITSTGLALTTGTVNIAAFMATNSGIAPLVSTIKVIPTSAGCIGTEETFTISVSPTVTVEAASIPKQVICDKAMSTVVAFRSPTLSGVDYNWTKDNTSIGLATSGTGNIAAFTAANSGTTPVTSTITVTPSYGTCAGVSKTFDMTVNPTVTVKPESIPNQVLCDKLLTNPVNFASPTSGVVYSWENDNTAIDLAATSGTDNIASFMATNSGTTPLIANIKVTPSYTNEGLTCPGTPSTFSITVNPTVTVTTASIPNQVICANTESAKVTFVSPTTGVVFNWTNNKPEIGLAASGTGEITKFEGINTGKTPIVATITVTPAFSNGGVLCFGKSETFTITINALPAINVQPVAITTFCAGEERTLKVEASGTGLSYQWKKGTELVGTNSDSYTVTTDQGDAESTAKYTVTVSGTCAPSVTSMEAEVKVNALTDITAPLAPRVICAGESTILRVTATGTGLTYQWQKGGLDIPNATNSAYEVTSDPNAVTSTTATYSVVVTGACGDPLILDAVVTVNALTKISEQPISTTICAGTPTILGVTATGTDLTYQWLKGGSNVDTARSATFGVPTRIGDAENILNYRVFVSGTCGEVLSNTARVTVNSLPKIITQPIAPAPFCAGLSTTLTADAAGTTGLMYQWQKDGVSIIGETSASLVVGSNTPDAASSFKYTVVVSGTCPAPVTSTAAMVVINALPNITTPPVVSTAICAGKEETLKVVAAGSGLIYQWKKDDTNIADATTAEYKIITAAADTASKAIYSVSISGTCAPTATAITSAKATVVVNALAKITAQPKDTTIICAGSNTIKLAVGATGSGLTYQWKKDGVNIADSTLATLEIPSITTDTASSFTYSVVVGATCAPALTSSNAVVTVNALLKVTARPSALTTVCVGNKATLSVSATGSGLTYQWTKDSVNITGANSANYTVDTTTAANSGVYSVIIGSTCSPIDTSSNVVLVIDPKPSAITGANSLYSTFTTMLSNTVSGGTWSSSDTLVAKVDSTGLVTGVSFGTAMISYTVSNACGVITVKKEFTVIRNTVLVNMKVFLQGPYNPNNGFMEATLRVNGYLPSVEPYSGMSNFVHKGSGGGEVFDNPAVTTIIGNNAIVDWVFIELRDKDTPSKVVATRSALLQRDGDIVETDGTSALTLYDVIAGDYYIAIRHRNHLGFRTAAPKTLGTTALTLNFTDGSTELFGRNPLKLVGAAYLMYAGNGDSNGAVNAIDKNNVWLRANGQFNYLRADFNMDGAVNAVDRNQSWLLNNSQVQQLD
jgi:Leucine rich repeat/Bacterial Ig-like domain (group 2)